MVPQICPGLQGKGLCSEMRNICDMGNNLCRAPFLLTKERLLLCCRKTGRKPLVQTNSPEREQHKARRFCPSLSLDFNPECRCLLTIQIRTILSEYEQPRIPAENLDPHSPQSNTKFREIILWAHCEEHLSEYQEAYVQAINTEMAASRCKELCPSALTFLKKAPI